MIGTRTKAAFSPAATALAAFRLSVFRLMALTLAAFAILTIQAVRCAEAGSRPPLPSFEHQSGSDDAAIRQSAADFAKEFAAGDAKSLAEQWTTDGTFVDENGQVHKGRADIEKLYRALFAKHGPAHIEINVESITFPAPSVAVEVGTTSLPGDRTASRYTAVHVKQDSQWKMSTVTETSMAAAPSEGIKSLDWLTGSWTAHGAKGAVHMKASWDTSHNFIYCIFGSGDNIDSSQIIGFDANLNRITSWHFDGGSGSYGRSIWTKKGTDWLSRGASREADGKLASAAYILHPVDANTFTWRSVDRSVNGQPRPDSTEVKVTRNI